MSKKASKQDLSNGLKVGKKLLIRNDFFSSLVDTNVPVRVNDVSENTVRFYLLNSDKESGSVETPIDQIFIVDR